MGKTIIYGLRVTGHRCACEQWETVVENNVCEKGRRQEKYFFSA